MSLFDMEPEKYYAPPGTWTKERIRDAIRLRIDSGKYLASEKMDGHWSRFVREGDECKMQTRSISKVTGTYGDNQKKVPFIFNFLQNATNGDTILLGELYARTGNISDVKKILGAGEQKALARQNKDEDKLLYYVFDVLMYNGISFMNTPFEERAEFMRETLKPALEQNKYIRVADFIDAEEVFDLLEEVFARDGEGAVLQDKSGKPEPGKRPSWKTIKIKKEVERDVDVFFMRALPPVREYNGMYIDTWPYWEDIRTGKTLPLDRNVLKDYTQGLPVEPVSKNYYYGWPAAIECGVYDATGKIWTVCNVSGLTETLKQDIINNPTKYRKRAMAITGMEFTEDYSIRHPRLLGFRDDINDTDCTWEKIFDRDF